MAMKVTPPEANVINTVDVIEHILGKDGIDEYQAEKAKILFKGEKPNRHNIVQFIAAMTCLVKDLENVDFGEAVYRKPQSKNDWMILYSISKKFDAIIGFKIN